MAKISGSADEARKLGLLRDSDGVTMNSVRVLFDARQHALGLASGFRPAEPGRVMAMGEDGLARFDMEMHIMQRAGYISEHDRLVGHELATVLCGGALVHPQLVTEEYLLEVDARRSSASAAPPRPRSASSTCWRRTSRSGIEAHIVVTYNSVAKGRS